jgi:FlaG/FlaF family flagellin (archaellin)
MQTSTTNDERGLSYITAACYLISITVCALAAYAAVQLTAKASSDALLKLSQPLGIF